MTVDEIKVDPGAGLVITAEPGTGVAVGVGVGVALPPGVGVGVGVGVGDGAPPEHVENLKEPIRVTQFVPAAGKYMFVYQNVQSSTGSTVIAL